MLFPLWYREVKSADLEILPGVRHQGDEFTKLLEEKRKDKSPLAHHFAGVCRVRPKRHMTTVSP